MKYITYIIFPFFLLFIGCSENSNSEQSLVQAFEVSVNMSSNEVRKLFADCEFQKVDLNAYGMCGGGEVGIEVSQNDTALFVFWEHWSKKELGGFILFDERKSYLGVHPEMSLKEFINIFPNSTPLVSHLDSKETIAVDNGNCWFTLDSEPDDYSAQYTYDDYGEAQFVKYIDTDKKIASIFVKNPE